MSGLRLLTLQLCAATLCCAISSNVVAEYATLPIDHWNVSVGTYHNRYWVNDQHYRAGGPIFIHDVGESNAEHPAQRYLGQSSSYLVNLLREFHGMGIVWEHRYFGDSQPFPVNLTTPLEHFKYLTTSQALADIPVFARTFRRPQIEYDLTPETTSWVMIGCSYSGARAALSRHEYPGTFHAAYAASATLLAQNNDTSYFEQVYRGMVGYGYRNCTKDLHAIMAYVDDQLSSSPENASSIAQLFLGPGAEHNTYADLTTALATIYDQFQGQGMGRQSSPTSLAAFCDYLEQDPHTGLPAPTTGLVPIYGARALTERYASWPPLTEMINKSYQTNCRDTKTNNNANRTCDLSLPRSSDPAIIAWTWMTCTEWGTSVGPNLGSHAIVSKYLLSQEGEDGGNLCNRQFPGAVEYGALPRRPATDRHNNGVTNKLHPTNTFWTEGEYDPWRSLTRLPLPADGEEGRMDSTEYILHHAEHCYDFRTTSSESARMAQGRFIGLLRKWLEGYK
ncbi:hypothetical protein ABOM_002348 [Aspergillus bombycis]|uniref:Serine peptidase n=1 Tax=Aspergillus bombycis TaxID=109264 RepID=A0A1F8ABJ9_9EURO|nr:hypothetical protein ABOM_002348 [Aspergillus bombycis]OGM49053.1 hypothetical protein ABOM_002348 [Aspergillus bombycis]